MRVPIPRIRAEVGIVLLFCAAFAFQVIQFARVSSTTYDEMVHLPAAYSYLAWNDYRLNPEHPPVVKKFAALPLMLRKVWPADIRLREQDTQPEPFVSTGRVIRRTWAAAFTRFELEWPFGRYFLYGVSPEAQERMHASSPADLPRTRAFAKQDFLNDADDLVFWGRMPVMVLGILLAVLVFLWSRELFGLAGGVLSLALFCFDPNFIAHSGLVTTDVGAAFFMFGTVYFLWRLCRCLELTSVILFLLFFGLALATKYSTVLLVPIFWLAVLGRIVSPQAWRIGAKGGRHLEGIVARLVTVSGLFVAAALSAYLVIWAAYGFRYSAAADVGQAAAAETQLGLAGPQLPWREPGHFPVEAVVRRTAAIKELLQVWPQGNIPEAELRIAQTMAEVPLGLAGRGILFAAKHKLLPEAFVYGFAYARMSSLLRTSFLRGELSNVGFHSYFFWTTLYKTPLPALLAIVAGIGCAVARKWPWNSKMIFLVAPVGVYLFTAVVSSLNIGHRHLLPIYPFLYVLAGGLALEWARIKTRSRRWITAAVVLIVIPLSCLFVFSPPWRPVRVYPDYLAYFNELAGGPRNGYKSLVDSNLDWGQGLKELKLWLEKRKIKEPICLCYFGLADPRYYGIVFEYLPGAETLKPGQPILKPGSLMVVSATALQGRFISDADHYVLDQILSRSKLLDMVGFSILVYEYQPAPAANPLPRPSTKLQPSP